MTNAHDAGLHRRQRGRRNATVAAWRKPKWDMNIIREIPMFDDIRKREQAGEILVYRRPERRPHRILRSADGVNWKAISGEFATLEHALDTIKRLHRWYGAKYQWCAERIATGDRTGLVFEDDDTPPGSE